MGEIFFFLEKKFFFVRKSVFCFEKKIGKNFLGEKK